MFLVDPAAIDNLSQIVKETTTDASVEGDVTGGVQMPMRHTDYAYEGIGRPRGPNTPALMPIAPVEAKRVEVMALTFSDPKHLAAMMMLMLRRANLSQSEAARRMGKKPQSVQQYSSLKRGQQRGVSMKWFAEMVNVCGGKIYVEFPEKPIR